MAVVSLCSVVVCLVGGFWALGRVAKPARSPAGVESSVRCPMDISLYRHTLRCVTDWVEDWTAWQLFETVGWFRDLVMEGAVEGVPLTGIVHHPIQRPHQCPLTHLRCDPQVHLAAAPSLVQMDLTWGFQTLQAHQLAPAVNIALSTSRSFDRNGH